MAPIAPVSSLFNQVPLRMLNSDLTTSKANVTSNRSLSPTRFIYLPNGDTTPSQVPTLTSSRRPIAAQGTRPIATEDGPFGFEPPAARLGSTPQDETFGFKNEISIPSYRRPEIFGFGSDPSGIPRMVVHEGGYLYYRQDNSKC
jgi:hypothetical protein